MTKPTKKKRSQPEVVSEVKLRRAALAYAAVAHLDISDPRWRRCWRALSVAAKDMVAATQGPVATAQTLPNLRASLTAGGAHRRSPDGQHRGIAHG
jgi:hypothetical protein